MKKLFLIPTAVILCLMGAMVFGEISAAEEEAQAMESVIRLHVRAADNSTEEQELKLAVRNEILAQTGELLKDCEDTKEAKEILINHLSELAEAGQRAVIREGKDHTVTAELRREVFEYREYEGFFLPEGEYESLIVTVGEGEGQNWWCVVFPSACYLGVAEGVETNENLMPSCFRLAKEQAEEVTVKWGIWEWIKSLFA